MIAIAYIGAGRRLLVLGNQVGWEWPDTAYVREDLLKELEAERDTLVRAIEEYLRETGGRRTRGDLWPWKP